MVASTARPGEAISVPVRVPGSLITLTELLGEGEPMTPGECLVRLVCSRELDDECDRAKPGDSGLL